MPSSNAIVRKFFTGPFLTFLLHVEVILTYKRGAHPFETATKGNTVSLWHFYKLGVSITWVTNRNRQTQLLETWKVIQLNLLRQKTVNHRAYQAVM